MKISKILLFIFSVLFGLLALCFVMPSDGLTVAGVRLDYPSLLDILGKDGESQDTVPVLSPEELMAQRLSELQGEKIEEFRDFCETNPARLYFPDNDESYLDPFFDAMDSASVKQMRIVHYGDSQLECDRISGDLRERFQSQFGGHGVGLVPAYQTIATYSLSQSTSPELGHYLNYGPASARAGHNMYGPMAQVNHVSGDAYITFQHRDAKTYPHAFPVSRIVVLADGEGSMSVRCDSVVRSLKLEGSGRYVCALPGGTKRLTLSISGEFDVYGIQLDDNVGVTIDNIPMRGCSGTNFLSISKKSIRPFFENENIKLIILQYGGNSVPHLNGPNSISKYMMSLRNSIRMFRKMSPESNILFVGPADMATIKNGELQTWPVLPELIDSLREMSLDEGVAFWDMYSAMGGKGSIIAWNKAVPQLAGSDYIHFTPKGAKKISDILYETLQFYYKFYRMRVGKEQDALRQEIDSIDSSAAADIEGKNENDGKKL